MVADDALGDAAYDGGVALRVDALAAHGLAHQQVELVDQLGASVHDGRGHDDTSPENEPRCTAGMPGPPGH